MKRPRGSGSEELHRVLERAAMALSQAAGSSSGSHLHGCGVSADVESTAKGLSEISDLSQLRRWSRVLKEAANDMSSIVYSKIERDNNRSLTVEGDEEEEAGESSTSGLDRVFFPCTNLVDNFSSIVGVDEVKKALLESLVLPRKYPHFFRPGFKPWSKILLFGPPGTGKSSVVRAVVANAFNADKKAVFAELSASDFLSSFFGESEGRVREIFSAACLHKGNVVIYLDEIDSLARQKHSSEDDTSRRIKNELLRGLECLDETSHVCCVATTNVPWELDRAIVRRFERRLYVGLPEANARCAMFQKQFPHLSEETLKDAVAATKGYSGSDIQTVCRFASMVGVRELLALADSMTDEERLKARPREVSSEDVIHAVNIIHSSVDSTCEDLHMHWRELHGE